MAQAADTGNQQNIQGQQNKAADATQQNQQSGAQSAPKTGRVGFGHDVWPTCEKLKSTSWTSLARKLAEIAAAGGGR